MMMREGRELNGSVSNSRSERILHGQRIGDEESRVRHMAVDERGVGLVMMRSYDDGQLRNVSNDRGFPIRDHDTSSKFHWNNLLKESENSMVDSVDKGLERSGRAGYGRVYDGLMERSLPVKSEMIGNLPTYAHNVGSTRYYGRTRKSSGHLVEDSESHGRSGIVTDLPAEDAGYRRHSRNMTGLPIEDSEFLGRTENMSDLVIEGAGYIRCARKVSGLPGEHSDHQRRTSRVTDLRFEDDERFQNGGYQQHIDREISLKSYEEGNRTRFRNEDSPHSLTPRSQSSGQHTPCRGNQFPYLEGPYQEVFRHPADGHGTGGTLPSSTCCSSYEIVCSKAGRNGRPVSNKDSTCLRAEYKPDMDRHVEYIHSENQSSGKVHRRAFSKDIYEKYANVQYYDNCIDSYGTESNDTPDPALSRHDYVGNFRKCSLEEDGRHVSDHILQEAHIVDIDGVNRTAHEIHYSGGTLKLMDRYLDYSSEANHETLLCGEDSYHNDGVAYDDQTWNLQRLEEGVQHVDEDATQIYECGDTDLPDQPERMSKRKRKFAGKLSFPNHRTSTLGGRGAVSYDDNRHLIFEDENELAHPNRSSSYYVHSKANAVVSKTKHGQPFAGLSKELQSRLSKPCESGSNLSKELQSRLSKPCESGSNNVKNRLKHARFVPHLYGPQASKHSRKNVSSCGKSSVILNHTTSAPQHYDKAQCISVKKRLKRASQMDVDSPDPQVSHLSPNLESKQKTVSKNSGSTKETGLLEEADLDHSILKVKPTEKDPPENTEELKRQADHWFLKCMLYLNANPGRQKKFKEQGKASTLKCIICSSSKEFVQTKDVATHAFTSLKIGLRTQHLGFHKALCVLMGWDPAAESNGRWVCKSLPDVEALALKEDIIVWPPVVIIHSGSARDFYNNNEKVKISTEQLDNILRDMGLSEGKTTICHGKPGNPNIMLVKFNGTLSGLEEAERLHNVFSEKKRGRAELQEINARAVCGADVAQVPEDNVEGLLYGYLGIVEDFDKLNFDMRRHIFAKSKKEILACVDSAKC